MRTEKLIELKKGITPGPWQVNGSMVVTGPYGKVIAEGDVGMDHPPKRFVGREEMKSNLSAMSAVPELIDDNIKLRILLAQGLARMEACGEAVTPLCAKIRETLYGGEDED